LGAPAKPRQTVSRWIEEFSQNRTDAKMRKFFNFDEDDRRALHPEEFGKNSTDGKFSKFLNFAEDNWSLERAEAPVHSRVGPGLSKSDRDYIRQCGPIGPLLSLAVRRHFLL